MPEAGSAQGGPCHVIWSGDFPEVPQLACDTTPLSRVDLLRDLNGSER